MKNHIFQLFYNKIKIKSFKNSNNIYSYIKSVIINKIIQGEKTKWNQFFLRI
jgi:hypothetical protein